jgi:DnaJ-class molecular chaperone
MGIDRSNDGINRDPSTILGIVVSVLCNGCNGTGRIRSEYMKRNVDCPVCKGSKMVQVNVSPAEARKWLGID